MNTKNSLFKLKSPFKPSGDQPEAIKKLIKGRPGKSVLLGVTGSGKTYSLANVIANHDKQVIILSPNKTLAAQLYEEFSLFFPENKVCYFVSYYDYYQPESYLPAQDIYIPKETKVNTEIERLRVEATASIINRKDTIIIASVSAIYSLGNPFDYRNLTLKLRIGQKITRKKLLQDLIFIQYSRNDMDLKPGSFRVLGNSITINLPYMHDNLRIELFGDKIDEIELVDKRENKVLKTLDDVLIFPAKHFVTTEKKQKKAIELIKKDLDVEAAKITNPLYQERLKTRISHDLEMLQETGYCTGIENYSRYFDGRKPGDAPYCLLDFFEDDFLLIIDESHIAIPQLGGMYKGDKARKKSLIDFGFRLPSAYDNRPLKFEEIEKYFKDAIFVSATPRDYEIENSKQIVEQIVRPTGITDPKVEIVSRIGQLEHLIKEINKTTKNGFRTLVTVLTKRSAEDLSQYLENKQIKVCYMHADIKTPQRTEILHKLRTGVFDCLVGINLLREGLDLPEVALVAILDADIEGFLRNSRSLIQTIGRAARNIESKVIFYADKVTQSMQNAIDETDRRRKLQIDFNKKHGITAKTIKRGIGKGIGKLQKNIAKASNFKFKPEKIKPGELDILIAQIEREMQLSAENLNFEKAIELREKLIKLRENHQKS